MPLAGVKDGKIVLETRYVDRHLVRQVPGATYSKMTERWTAPLSWASCVVLRTLFRDDLELSPELAEWELGQRVAWLDNATMLRGMDAPSPTWSLRASDVGLRPFQRVGVRFMECVDRALLGDPMGSGKTAQVIRTLMRYVELYGDAADVFPTLVVAPNGVMLGWEHEFSLWWPGIDVAVVHGSMADRRRILSEPHHVYVINYEGLRAHSRLAGYGAIRLRRCVNCDKNLPPDEKHPPHLCERCPKELNQMTFKTLVVDEAHRLKSPSSKQTRAAWAVSRGTKRRFALTGTPIERDPSDLWPIMHLLSPEDFPSREAYVDLFCQKGYSYWGTAEILGLRPEFRNAFFSVVDPRLRRLPKEVILPQLPPVVHITRVVAMGGKQRRAYLQMQKYMAANLDGELLLAPNPMAKIGRLMQLAAAYAVIETHESQDGSTQRIVQLTDPSCKLDALEDVLDELDGESVVVASASRKLANLAVARLQRRKITVGLIAGGLDIYARKVVEQEYQSGKIRVVVCVIDAAAEGLTLTRGRTLVYINRHWSATKNKQMDDRVHRIGSEGHDRVQIIDIIARDTVETRQRELLAAKGERFEEIVRDRQMMEYLLGVRAAQSVTA